MKPRSKKIGVLVLSLVIAGALAAGAYASSDYTSRGQKIRATIKGKNWFTGKGVVKEYPSTGLSPITDIKPKRTEPQEKESISLDPQSMDTGFIEPTGSSN